MGQPTLVIIIVMGVAGAGKTTIGRRLADALGYEFQDADDFHLPENVEKMRRGERLDDRDRAPWLAAMAAAIDGWLANDRDVVLAASALKRAYRTQLLRDPERMKIVYLKVTPDVARARVSARTDHFMPDDLVNSQFDALEEPADAVTVDASQPPDHILRVISTAL
jgi:gluconokinase